MIASLTLFACQDDVGLVGPGKAPNGVSRAFSAWTPGPGDTCTPEIHDRFATVGPDGKLYPTWHPPVDPQSGCTFGHEHGRDPRGSDLFDEVGYIPFGLANEAADLFAPHPGYKVEWENDVEMRVGLGDLGGALFTISCDVMVELHQGSAGSGRFVNPHHELAYHARCSEGTELHFQIVTTIGHAGEFVRSCDSGVHVVVAPDAGGRDGGGKRLIPDRTCVERHILVAEGQTSRFSSGLRESWQFSESLRAANGETLASVGPYFNVFNPSRYHDPDKPDLLGNAIDLCYEVMADGNRARGGPCEGIPAIPVAWNDPASPFDGAHRDVDINGIRIRNEDGPEVWYTDAYGKNGSPERFPGSIRQVIAGINNEVVTPSGPSIGRDRHYGGQGVHPPN
jgi:hypothetical protein